MRAIPQVCVDFVKREEACRLTAYADSGGVSTIGYGHTDHVSEGETITQEQADSWLVNDDLPLARTRLYNASHADEVIEKELTDNQYAALLSFVFNLGANPDWTIWTRLRAKDFDQIPVEMMRFVNVRTANGTVKVKGLVKRRADEVQLWSTDEPGSVAEQPSSSATRAAQTPPTVSDPVPASRTTHIIAAGATAIAAVPAGANKAIQAVTPYADKSQFIQHIVTVLAIVAAIGAIATLAFAWLNKRKAQH